MDPNTDKPTPLAGDPHGPLAQQLIDAAADTFMPEDGDFDIFPVQAPCPDCSKVHTMMAISLPLRRAGVDDDNHKRIFVMAPDDAMAIAHHIVHIYSHIQHIEARNN